MRFKALIIGIPVALSLVACGTAKTETPAKTTAGTEAAAEAKTDAGQELAQISADDVIEDVQTIGFVDTDGAKLSAIAVKYSVDLTGAQIDADAFSINNFGMDTGDEGCEMGSDPGKALKAYVSDKAEVGETNGSGSFVIIEVNTDYQVGRAAKSYKLAMYADVTQTGIIRTSEYEITPGEKAVGNYTVTEVATLNPQTGGMRDPEYYNYADDGTYTIHGIEDYELT